MTITCIVTFLAELDFINAMCTQWVPLLLGDCCIEPAWVICKKKVARHQG
jgi:hypothetical protein